MDIIIEAKVIITTTAEELSIEDKERLMLQAEIAVNSKGAFESDHGLAGIHVHFGQVKQCLYSLDKEN